MSSNYIEEKEKVKFEFKVEKLTEAIQERIKVYNQAISSGIALMHTSEAISREQWKTFVEELNLEENWPGIQGLGYSIPVPKQDLQQHIQQIRSEGFPDFTVKPEGDRDFYTSIIYLEPFDWRNKRAFGYDMWSNKMRRQALIRARDSGSTSTSGLITLVQETEKDIQKGFLVYMPLYKKGQDLKSTEQRKAAFKGWVYGAFRTGDFMKGILASSHSPLENITGLRIYDQVESEETLMYNSNPEQSLEQLKNNAQAVIREEIDVGGRSWILKFYSVVNTSAVSKVPQFIAIAGVIIDLLLFYVIFSLSTVRKKAVQIANQISSEIKEKNVELREKQLELIEAGESLKSSEKRVQAILNNTVDGIATIDAKGTILSFNKACEELFEYKREEVLGKNVNMLMPEPHHTKHDSYLKNFLETGEAKIIGLYREVEGTKKSGKLFPIHLSVSTFNDSGEQIFIGIIRDITERKASENKIERMVGELTESNSDLERFAYIASHDLQEPLRMIANFNGLLLEEYGDKLDDNAKEYMKFSCESTSRMQKLVAGILEYSSVSGKGSTQEKVDLNKTVHDSRKFLAQKIFESEAEIHLDKLPEVKIDIVQAGQLFQNLISNSLNYQKPGKKPVLNISCEDDGAYWKIIFSDNGIGIEEKYFESIFSPFKRLHSYSQYKGSGIGLSLCKRIVENAGGSISVTSKVGEGTSFIISLPKLDGEA